MFDHTFHLMVNDDVHACLRVANSPLTLNSFPGCSYQATQTPVGGRESYYLAVHTVSPFTYWIPVSMKLEFG